MNATRRGWVPLLFIVTACLWLTACGDVSNEAADGTSKGPTEPLVTAPRPDVATDRQLSTSAGGIASRYTPQFDGETLVRIDERRERGDVQSALGTYAFQGARLMRYEGAPIDGKGTLILELDLQGKVITARHDDAAATDEQISAIRTRAQLLRNLALAQHVTRTHGNK